MNAGFKRAAGALVLLATLSPFAASGAEAPEPIRVVIDKSTAVRTDRAASIVMVGQPEIADVTVENPRLIFVLGRKVGETNLVILDSQGNYILNLPLVVTPEGDRQVTIYRGSSGVSTLSCDPRCAGVKNPGTEKEADQKGGGGAALPGLGSPSSAPKPSPGAAGGAPALGASADGSAGLPIEPAR